MAGSVLSIVDDLGQVVRLEAPAQRLLSLYGAYNEILIAMGLGHRIVGRTKADAELPELAAKPSIGTHMRPNVEMIVGLQPDLILQDAGRQEAMPGLEQLRRQRLPVAVFHPISFAQLFSVIDRLGVLTGAPEAAARLRQDLEQRLAAVAAKVSKAKHRPKVFFEVRYPNLLAAGRHSIVHDIITKAGGENCVSTKKKIARLNLEAVIAADPEVYLIQRGPMNPRPEPVQQRPHYALLRAVQTNRVLVVDEHLYSRPGPQAVKAVEELARFLHPDLFSESDS